MTHAIGTEGPVTVIVSWLVKPGREHEFEAWIEGVTHAALLFPGHLGVNIIRPNNAAQQPYVLIFRFDTYEHLKQWEDSDVQHMWLARANALKRDEPRVQKMTGLEYWFTLPEMPSVVPSRFKMVVITIVAIYFLNMLINLMFEPWLNLLPFWLRGLLTAIMLVPLMTYLVMPQLTRLCARWLFPQPENPSHEP